MPSCILIGSSEVSLTTRCRFKSVLVLSSSWVVLVFESMKTRVMFLVYLLLKVITAAVHRTWKKWNTSVHNCSGPEPHSVSMTTFDLIIIHPALLCVTQLSLSLFLFTIYTYCCIGLITLQLINTLTSVLFVLVFLELSMSWCLPCKYWLFD